jgi:hypothetical protein
MSGFQDQLREALAGALDRLTDLASRIEDASDTELQAMVDKETKALRRAVGLDGGPAPAQKRGSRETWPLDMSAAWARKQRWRR